MRNASIPAILIALSFIVTINAEPPVYPRKTEGERPSFIERVKAEIPPLKNERGTRWPMIMWECLDFEPKPPEIYKALLDRGLTQHVRMDPKMIPTAKAIQKAGAPVIMMQGSGGAWPYNMAKSWAHQYVEGYEKKVSKRWWPSWKACPAVFEGWRVNADRVRETLRAYRDAGVTVDAVWMDWEGEPSSSGAKEGWENATHCKRCRETLPPAVLRDHTLWRAYCYRLHKDLIASYLAAPVREVFPGCSVTNWMLVCSTEDRVVRGWGNGKIAATVPSMVTGTNPVAYGNDVFWKFWEREWPLERLTVDRFYTHLLLRQVSDDTANKLIFAPEKDSFPWVARWCPDVGDPKIPMISREAYREALRHLWLRGADSLQIFNATRKGYEDIVFAEVVDAVAVYDEMLAYVRFLEEGEVVCCDVPDVRYDGVLWSGLRLESEALVRVISQSGKPAKAKVEPWPGTEIELVAPPDGATYVARREEGKLTAARQ